MGLFNKEKNEQARHGAGTILTTGVEHIGDDLDFASKEAFSLLRENIDFVCPQTAGRGRLIGITSADPAEGKTYTAINLAYFLAKRGAKVILVDADMRRPAVSKSMNLDMDHGLSNLLSTGKDFIVHQSMLNENLSILTCGKVPPNPAELIGNSNMGDAMQFFANKYEYVILDLPPVNVVSDCVSVAKYLDGIAVVIKHNQTNRREATACIRTLQLAKVKILGIVYNGYTTGRKYYGKYRYKYGSKYGYGGGYGYGYGYGYSSEETKTEKKK